MTDDRPVRPDPVEPNVDAIPDTLRERDQWLTWDAATDRKQPYWGDQTVSWSDPEVWHSYEAAREKAEQQQSWGVGYVCAAENDDYPVGVVSVIDLDGAADANDQPKDWVPSLDVFSDKDAYIEWSQSHDNPGDSGLHIPVAGAPPEWWRDVDADGEHEGIDLLANKFCIFTGDRLRNCGDEIPSWDGEIEAWLADAYENLTDETAPPRESGGASTDPDKAGSHDSTGEEWLDEETVAEALGKIDADCAYSKWRNIGFGLADHFTESKAKRLFEQWSSEGASKYDENAEDLIEDIAGRGTGNRTIGTVVHHAKEAGWDPSFGGGDDYDGTPSARELVARHSDEYDTVEDVPEDFFGSDESGDGSAKNGQEGQTETDEDGSQTANSGPSWEDIRGMFQAAEDADERQTPRFQAAMKLHTDYHFATLVDNDLLYVYDDETGTYHDGGEATVRSELTRGLEEQYRGHDMNEALDHIRGRTLVDQDQLGGPEGLIAAQNCVIDLHEQSRQEHDPKHLFLHRLGCEFDPDATAPRFHEFLEEVVPSGTDRTKLQEFAGYTMLHWGMPFHKALFLVGPTASGKSTFLDTINAMLGADTVASLTPQQLTTERFSGAELFGKWANIRNDIPAATVENTGQFKEIVGGDPMKAERKRKDPFHFEPTAKHLFAANELPSTETDDEAFYRRILLVPFPETIPEGERDKRLDSELQAELPGVLNWALEGLQRLLANGGFTGDRSPGETQRTWQKWADSVSRFKNDAITSGNDSIPKPKLYAAYIEYCRQEGIPSDTQNSMTRGLKKEGLEDGRGYVDGEQKRVFMNVEWTGRGRQLLEDARADTESDETKGRRETGLSGWD